MSGIVVKCLQINSAGITFDGDVLQPETRYYVTVRV